MNLFGIESPGLTASLALADEVLSRLASQSQPMLTRSRLACQRPSSSSSCGPNCAL